MDDHRNGLERRGAPLLRAARARLATGARDERGAVAIMFALAVVVLAPLILGLFDVYTASEQRSRLQDALDAAALHAARSTLNTDAEIDALGDKALTANLHLLRGATLTSSDFHLTDNDTRVVASATIQPLALAPDFWAHPPVTVRTDVVRNSKNLEVALVLDVTGSMNNGTRIADLRTAAKQLVDIVVKDQQTPFYSKVAVVPWSMGVNLGGYADQARGPAAAGRAITDAGWRSGSDKSISGATKSNPVVVTANNHGFSNGDKVYIRGVKGMTQINDKIFTVANKTSNTFQLQGVNGNGYKKYKKKGKVTKCKVSDCSVVVNSSGHGFSNGDIIYIDDVGGLSNLNDKLFTVADSAADSFSLDGATAMSGLYDQSYTSGGSAYCTTYGCEYYRFTNGDNSAVKLFKASTCVSERTGAQAYTDAAPSAAYVGFNYPAPASGVSYAGSSANTPNPCLSNEIIPLSTNKTAVKAAISGLVASGSTAGQVGTAWGWYMVSPNFAYMWPAASKPAAYNTPNTLKAVVLMTDGALNSPYCNGVIAKNAISGSGSIRDHHDCDATNGTTLNQSLALCASMKAAGVMVYTVGFQITGDSNAETLMSSCASSPKHQYLPTSGAALSEAFEAIGAELNNLRLAH